MYDPEFSRIEQRRDEPPDEPHPRYFDCPVCGSIDVKEAGRGVLRCGYCEHEWDDGS